MMKMTSLHFKTGYNLLRASTIPDALVTSLTITGNPLKDISNTPELSRKAETLWAYVENSPVSLEFFIPRMHKFVIELIECSFKEIPYTSKVTNKALLYIKSVNIPEIQALMEDFTKYLGYNSKEYSYAPVHFLYAGLDCALSGLLTDNLFMFFCGSVDNLSRYKMSPESKASLLSWF